MCLESNVSMGERSTVASMLALVLLIVPVCGAAQSKGWERYSDVSAGVQFLSIGTPEKRAFDGPGFTKTIWHFGYLPDGSNGYVEATHLDNGGMANFDVVKNATELRRGIQKAGRVRVISERSVHVAGRRAIEFRTKTMKTNASVWYGVMRMVVLGDAMYTIAFATPSRSRLDGKQVNAYLESLRLNKSR